MRILKLDPKSDAGKKRWKNRVKVGLHLCREVCSQIFFAKYESGIILSNYNCVLVMFSEEWLATEGGDLSHHLNAKCLNNKASELFEITLKK